MALTISHADAVVLVENLSKNAKIEQAQLFSQYVDQLKTGNAEAVAVTSLGGHFCIEELKATSSLPIIDAISVLNNYFRNHGIKRVGVIGTRVVMESKLYEGTSSAEIITPSTKDYDEIHDTYISMAMAGFATETQKAFFHDLVRGLCVDAGAEAILLGGTDLFLAFDGQPTDFTIIVRATVHIEEISKLSINS